MEQNDDPLSIILLAVTSQGVYLFVLLPKLNNYSNIIDETLQVTENLSSIKNVVILESTTIK